MTPSNGHLTRAAMFGHRADQPPCVTGNGVFKAELAELMF